MHGHGGALHAVAWHPVRTSVFATACEAPRAFVFDAAARGVIKSCAVDCALRACAWSSTPVNGRSHHLALGGSNGKLIILEEDTLKPRWETKDCQQGITDLKYSPDGAMLAVATADRHVGLYKVGTARYTKAARCVGHSSLVRHVDWSRSGGVLQSVCSAYETLFWNAATGKQVTATQRDTAWHTWTCTLGFPVMGIWPEDADGTDINAADRDAAGALLATADDCGTVKLFNYPCVVEDAPHRAYSGHSSHVTCVRFSGDGKWLASAGGSDRTVLQFRVAAVAPPAAPPPPPEPVWGTVDGKSFGWTTHPSAISATDEPTAAESTAAPAATAGIAAEAHINPLDDAWAACEQVVAAVPTVDEEEEEEEEARDEAPADADTGGW